MKEIGGYFGLEQYQNNTGEYYKDLICLNTARNSLVYISKARNIKKIYIPYFLCDSVSLVCERENIEYEYYHIDSNFYPVFDKELKENECLYIVNYYGQLSNEMLIAFKNKYKNIIVDNVQAFFQKPIEGIDTIYSCRKFFGVPDGSYLSTNVLLNEMLETDISDDRTKHIYGRIKDGATAHYNEFRINDELFRDLRLMNMSNLTHNMLSTIDYEKIKTIRTDNYKYLYEKLDKYNKLDIDLIEGAYAYPFYCENGMMVKKELAKKKIYVATLWPNVPVLNNGLERNYTENILPLPCDQRYCKEEMKIIIKEIYRCTKI